VTLVTVGAGTIVRGALASPQGAEEPSKKSSNAADTSVLARSEVVAAVAAQPNAPKKKEMIVTGKVLGPDGKPVVDAQVSVTALLLASAEEHRLGSAKTDSEGRFRLPVRRTSSKKEYQVHVIAAAAGFGLGWQSLQPDAEEPQA